MESKELDAEVAEKVMGTPSIPEDAVLLNNYLNSTPGSCGSPSIIRQRLLLEDPNYWGYSTLSWLRAIYYKPYSTSISDAWLVVEEMNSRGRRFTYTQMMNGVSGHFVQFFGPSGDYMSDVIYHNGEGDTAPEAICMAALEACDETKP